MAKFSGGARRRFARVGAGTSVCLRHRLPRAADRLPRAPRLSREARVRLRFLEHAVATRWPPPAAASGSPAPPPTAGSAATTRATWPRWRTAPRGRASPAARRGAPWATAEQAEAVRRLRERHPRWGKDKLAVLLRREGVDLSGSMVGRILADLKRRGRRAAAGGARAAARRAQAQGVRGRGAGRPG